MSVPPLQKVMVHTLEGPPNQADGIRSVLRERGNLTPGLRLDGPGVELIVGACDPVKGRYNIDKTEVIVGVAPLKVFEKVHVLPYLDTFAYNYDHMYNEHLVPYFQNCQQGEFSDGCDFSHNGVRFNVVGVFPAGTYGVVGQQTVVFYEGPPIERKVLQRLHLLPYEDGLPEKYRPSKLQLDEKGLLSDYIKPYFEQRSLVVSATSEPIEIDGVRFKIVSCRPSEGGGVGKDTELVCQGVALKTSFAPKSGAKAKAKATAKAKAGAAANAGAAGQNEGQCTLS